MSVGWILLFHWQSCSGSAIGLDEDRIAEDKGPIPTAVGLLRADVAGGLVIDAVVPWNVKPFAFGEASTIDSVSMLPKIEPWVGSTYQESWSIGKNEK
jgi:hypothetical protein